MSPSRLIARALSLACLGALVCASAAGAATGGPKFAPGEVVVRAEGERDFMVLELPSGIGVREAARSLNRNPEVAYAVPNHIATVAEPFIPDDPGKQSAGDTTWEDRQWNFLDTQEGIDAPNAWANLIATGHPGGANAGVKVAVIDTGVAYKNRPPRFARSPDFVKEQFTKAKWDWVGDDPRPMDKMGHGTHVAGTIGEQTDNGIKVTGLAYGAKIMPLRVLDASGRGKSGDVAKAIRFAAKHGADVINLSLEFEGVTSGNAIPNVREAIKFSYDQGAVITAAAGNIAGGESKDQVAYPARLWRVIAVGATTRDHCLSSFSQHGTGLDLVAPGGGNNATWDTNCPGTPTPGIREIHQVTFSRWDYVHFGIKGRRGTSMASAHAAGVAALVIASGVPQDQVRARLQDRAHDLGDPNLYGAGLLDAEAATAP